MANQFFYAIQFNVAVAQLGLPPDGFPKHVRATFQRLGNKLGLTPQEAVVVMVAQLMGIGAPNTFEASIGHWRASGKVNLDSPEMQDALAGTYLE